MPSSTRKSSPPDSSPPLSPSDVPAVKSPQEPRLVSLFLPSPPSSSPPRPVASATVLAPTEPTTEQRHLHLLRLIAAFLRSDNFQHGSIDLEIASVSTEAHRALLREQETPQLLTGHEADSLRHHYTPETGVLTIACMPTAVHESGTSFASDVLLEMRESHFLSLTERRKILFDAGTDVALPTLSALSRVGSKSGGTAAKQPDAAYYFIDRTTPEESDRCPRVVFEIGFSQSYESLCRDAEHWLVRAAGFVKLVVLVKLFESPHPEAEVDDAEVATKLREQILAVDTPAPSNPDADAPGPVHDTPPPAEETAPPVSPTSSHSSTAADYDTYFKSDPTPFVGAISGFIELHRYDAVLKRAYRCSPRCDIFAAAHTQTPSIRITDLLPAAHIEGDPAREFALPLELFRQHVAVGVRKLAANRRAARHVAGRKRRVEDDSGVFVPQGGEVVAGVEGQGEGARKRRRGPAAR